MTTEEPRVNQHLAHANGLIESLSGSEGISEQVARRAVMATLQGYGAHGVSMYDTEAFLGRARKIARGVEEIARRAAPKRTVAEPWRPRRIR